MVDQAVDIELGCRDRADDAVVAQVGLRLLRERSADQVNDRVE